MMMIRLTQICSCLFCDVDGVVKEEHKQCIFHCHSMKLSSYTVHTFSFNIFRCIHSSLIYSVHTFSSNIFRCIQ